MNINEAKIGMDVTMPNTKMVWRIKTINRRKKTVGVNYIKMDGSLGPFYPYNLIEWFIPIQKKIDVSDILSKGTRIVSFDYDGVRRNVLVGSKIGLNRPPWGKVKNRAIRTYGSKTYLVGIDNNDGHQFKTFDIEKITNASF